MILDTNALSAWAKRDEKLLAILPPPSRLLLPVIVIGEYMYGIERSTQRNDLRVWLDRAVRSLRVAPITLATADVYASLRALLHRKGRPIPANDLWIASLALQHHVPVITRDSHFDAVDGLTRITW